MKIEHRRDGDAAVVRIEGELNVANSDGLVSRFRAWHGAGPARRYVFDLTATDLIDSSGIGALVTCLLHVRKTGGDLALAGVQGKARMVIELARADRIFTHYPTVAAALAAP